MCPPTDDKQTSVSGRVSQVDNIRRQLAVCAADVAAWCAIHSFIVFIKTSDKTQMKLQEWWTLSIVSRPTVSKIIYSVVNTYFYTTISW